MKKKSGYFKIKESADELQQILENSFQKDYAKLQFLLLLKDNKDISYSHVREILGVPFKTMMVWKQLYEKGGLAFLLKGEILEKDDVLLQKQILLHSPADLDRKQKSITIQKNGNNTYWTEDVHTLKEWIADNYMTKQDFMDKVNELRSESITNEETVSVLRRVIEFLKK